MFSGRVALVTGAGSGIGRASAIAFAKEGARVVVSDVDHAGGLETVREIEAAYGEASFIPCNVADSTQVSKLFEATLELWGRLDYAHNNAGVSQARGKLANVDINEWHRVIQTNLSGVFLCMQAEIKIMQSQGEGAIVNTASTVGLRGGPGLAVYSASKHGVIGLTRSAALEYAKSGIRINAVCPGAVATPMLDTSFPLPEEQAKAIAMSPIGRIGTPDDIAGLVVWLCSPAAGFITAAAMVSDGGITAR